MCRAIRQVRINVGKRSGGKHTKADRRNFGVDLISLAQHARLLRFERRKRADLLLEQRLELLGGSQAQLALVGLFACSLRSGLCLQRAAAESVDTLRTSLRWRRSLNRRADGAPATAIRPLHRAHVGAPTNSPRAF
jgi:hypothetical protein